MAQSSTPLVSYWHPDITYDFSLMIGEVDYSTDVTRVRIRSGINVPYQNIFLDLFIDSREILREQLFGQEPIKLTIRLEGKEKDRYGDDIIFDLMYIETETDFGPAQQSYMDDQWERTLVRLKTIPIEAYQIMTTMVNEIYFNKTPQEIISNIVFYNTPFAYMNYDSQGQSSLKIDQMVIPPTTIYKIIKYINNTYGVFNGPMGLHCTFDNKLKIQNLSKKVKDAQKFTLYLLATNVEQSTVFDTDDASMFYTKTAVSHSYQGNSVFAVSAPSLQYIVKPRDTLYASLDIDLESLTKEFGVIEQNNPSIFFNSTTIDKTKRIRVKIDKTGYDLDTTFIESNLSKNIFDMSVIMATIEGNLPVLNLMEVGEHVKIVSQVDEHLKLGGSYILKASDIQFIKAQGWEPLANIYMVRSNIAAQ